MRVTVVPCLSDNYAYLLDAGGPCLVVDPSEEAPVSRALERLGLPLAGVLATHHHFDHVGGIEALAERHPGLEVLAFEGESRVPGKTRGVADGARFELAGLSFEVLHVPGHTLGAIAFVGEGAAFTGDTLFRAGCGRLFEGTPALMFASLARLAALPPETRLYCGHEYTQKNLRFAQSLEPESEPLRVAAEQADRQRARGEPTMGTSLGLELETNPFLRAPDAWSFAERRRARDAF